MTLLRATAPATLPLSLAEVKAHLRVDFADDDSLIGGLLAAAVAYVDGTGVLGRAMITQDWAQWVNQSPGRVRLEMGPFQSLVSVQYYDADGVLQTATLADFETWLSHDHVICKPKDDHEWPNADTRPDAIKITYRAGFGDDAADVPQTIKQAMLMLIAHWYERRESASEDRLVTVPFGFESLMSVERVSWYG